MGAYLSWSVEILVPNVIESMKWSLSKQLADHIFARCMALARSLHLAVSLCRLASTEGISWEYRCAWHQFTILRKYLTVFHIAPYALLNTCPFSQHTDKAAWPAFRAKVLQIIIKTHTLINTRDFLLQCASSIPTLFLHDPLFNSY